MSSMVDSDKGQLSGASDSTRQRGIRITVAVIVAFMLAVVWGFYNKITSPRVLNAVEMRANGTVVFENPRIISDFSLRNQSDQPVSVADLEGNWSLVFFGFTACPDVCPSTLAVMKKVKETLDDDFADQVNFVLVTVDPARDTSRQLKQYLAYFDADFSGWTGEFLDIKRFANQLNTAFVKVPQGEGDYTIDHSAHVSIINPYGHYHGFIKSPPDAPRIKLTLQSIMTTFGH